MHIARTRFEESAETPLHGSAGPVPDTSLMQEAGQLMYAAHQSYSDRLDLGAAETDLLVDLIRHQGPSKGLFGARITGGAAGGTVAVLCMADLLEAEGALQEVCGEYMRRTGIQPGAFVGSSPGAVMFGARPI